MSLCTFAPNSNIYDITPVENIFIEEFMRHAPGEAVKVYIYGLKLCYHDSGIENLEEFSRALGMSLTAVAEAFAYWENTGLVVRVSDSPLRFAFYNVKNRLFDSQPRAPLYEDESFNISLQSLFAPRPLKAEDFKRVYDWVDIYGIEREAVLLLASHMIAEEEKKQPGKRPSIAQIEKEAKSWAEKGIRAKKDAQSYLASFDASYESLQNLLSYISIKRPPSMPEYELYKKWTGEWGFSYDAITAACKELNKIANPNMAYLNSVLQSFLKQGLTTPAKISRYIRQREDRQQPINEVWHELGASGKPAPKDEEAYTLWVDSWGFPHETVLAAARYAASIMPKTFDSISHVLDGWRAREIFSPQSAHSFLDRIRGIDAELRTVYSRAGVNKKPSEADRMLYQSWMDARYQPELVYLAAEYSAGAKNPLQYINRLLSIWRDMGIKTIGNARAEHGQRQKEQMRVLTVKPNASDYPERDYTNADFTKYIVDLSKYYNK
ncbi:MAG: DnaD domain protein [Bacillota bacterium]|nr:DnaD domain protein [Bacillota bacterium]